MGECAGWSPIARVQRGPSQAARCAIFPLLSRGHGLIGSPTAPVEQGLCLSLSTLSMGEWPACSHRARVERPPFHRGGSASTESGRPLPHDRTSMMMYQQPLVPDPFEEVRG